MKKKYWIGILIAVIIAVASIFILWKFFINTAQNAHYVIEDAKGTAIEFIEEKSFFDEFKTEGNNVYFYCNIAVKNGGQDTIKFKLSAVSEEDKNSGLLKNAKMKIIDSKTSEEQIFEIEAGQEQIYEVEFFSEKGDQEALQKMDRMLPETIIMTVL